MFRSLRNGQIASHVLPLLAILPLMGLALVYILEQRLLIPQLAQNLLGQARMLAEISSVEYDLWGDPILFRSMVERVKLDPAIDVMFLSPSSRLLYSSDPADEELYGQYMEMSGMGQALAGNETALTNYSLLRQHHVEIIVLEPVIDARNVLIGVVRVTYQVTSVYELTGQVRFWVIGILAAGLLAAALLGTWLALSINRPLQRVTSAIYSLAAGKRREPLEVSGPDELRSQVQAVNYLVQQLESLEKARRQLLANLVHELGRPLGALRSAIHALSKGAAKDEKLLDDLTRGMDEETVRMQVLLDDLAHLYDQALGSLELNLQPIDMREWLPGVLRPWEIQAQEKRLTWQEELPPGLPRLAIDSVRLAQVVGNLLNNAIKYTPSGGSVTVKAGSGQGEFWLAVSDSGPGIPAWEQEKIFAPFYRGGQGRRIKQGMGLGLSIARDLAAAHGGRIEVDSTPPSGSTFTLYLPVS